MFSVVRDTLEDALLPGACTSTGANKITFVLHEVSNYSPLKRTHIQVLLSYPPLPSINFGLHTSFTSAITVPEFTFYKKFDHPCKIVISPMLQYV